MKLINQDKTLKYSAFQKMKDEMDRNTKIQSAREEGIECQARKTAFNLFKMGQNDAFISETTELSLETVIELRQLFDSGIISVRELNIPYPHEPGF